MPYLNNDLSKKCFELWKKIWDNRDLLIVEGEKTRLGVNNDLFDNVHSIKRILCPNVNAFCYYETIKKEVLKYSVDHLVLLAVGPTATVLAVDICKCGYQAIDIGHLDIEYEWFLMQSKEKVSVADKFVNEAGAGKGVGSINDPKYISEIVCHF